MKKFLTMLLCAMLLLCALPLSALAGSSFWPAECYIEGHYWGDGLDHSRPQSCWVTGHNSCDGMNHERAACGVWAHFNCDGREHPLAPCGAPDHYTCDKRVKHAAAGCGVAGHCISDGKRHAPTACGIAGHVGCDGMNHQKLPCGHFTCDGGVHGKAACGAHGHYSCDGREHAIAACGRGGHCVSDGKTHEVSFCGVQSHFLCDGRNHELAACGVDGHFVCFSGHHYDKLISKYCNAFPQHRVCERDPQHYCDPATGGCGDTYLCSNSNAHTPCRMCGLLWCDRSLGGHETPCDKANHRPCVYTMEGRTYVRADHDFCGYCGRPRCERAEHGNTKCVPACPVCGGPEKLLQKHTMACGHYGCKPTKARHNTKCDVCGHYLCEEGYTHDKCVNP